jgi:WD40 repeat protein
MGQPILLRIVLLLSVLLLTACTLAPPPAPTPMLPAPTSAPAQSAAAPTATIAPTPLIATAAPTTAPALAEQHASNSQLPLPPIHPRLLRTIGIGKVVVTALSPDGQFLALGTTVGWGFYTMPDLQQVRFEEIAQGVHTLVWSANSRRLAIGSAQGASVYRFPEGVLASRQPRFSAWSLIFSPDGTTIASLYTPTRSSAESVGQPPLATSVTLAHSDAGPSGDRPASFETYGSLAFSPDNTLLATESETETLLWKRDASSDLLTSTLALRVPGKQPMFSPNSRVLATTEVVANSMVVRLWRVPSGRPLAHLAIGEMPAGNPNPPPVVFRRDGTQLALVLDGQLQLWDIAPGRLVRTQDVRNFTARLISGAKVLVTYPDENADAALGIRFTRLADGHVLYQDDQAMVDFGSDVDPLTWSADGMIIGYLTRGAQLHVIDLAHGATHERTFPYYANPIFSPDGRSLAAVQLPETVALWHMDDPAFVQQRSLGELLSSDLYRRLDRVEFTPDGRSLVAQEYGSAAQSLHVAAIQWDMTVDQPGRIVWEIHQTDDDRPIKETDTYLYSPATRTAAWANRSGIQMQRDGQPTVMIAPPSASQVIDMMFSADGRLLAVSDNGGILRLFNSTPITATLIQTLSVMQGYGIYGVDGVIFSPDGTLFGLPDSGIGRVWRVGEPAPFVRFGFESGESGRAVFRFIISPDNQLLIALRSSTIAFYRLSDGRELGILPVPGWGLGVIMMSYESIAISPLGDQLAMTNNGRILIWEISS